MYRGHATSLVAMDHQPEQFPARPDNYCREPQRETQANTVRIEAGYLPSLWAYFRELLAYRELLHFLVWRDVLIRYRRTLLGVAWLVLQPLLQAAIVWWLVASRFGQNNLKLPALIHVVLGTTLWLYSANTVLSSVHHLSTNAHLITKVYFPRALLVLAPAVTHFLDLGLMTAFIVAVLAFHGLVHTNVWLLVMCYVGTIVYTQGPALIAGGLAARYRDIKHMAPYFMQLWFFSTPAIYLPHLMQDPGLIIAVGFFNPLNSWVLLSNAIVERAPMLPLVWITAVVSSNLWCLLGYWIFIRLEQNLADHI
ncbi:hypothetical protein HRbin36_00027 [bacterium HR36]|nr:hypothetical protein HRbin36_00027 [bacterium HR36]